MAQDRFGKFFEAKNKAYDDYFSKLDEAKAEQQAELDKAKEAASAASDVDLGEDASWINAAMATNGMDGLKPTDIGGIAAPADTGSAWLNSAIDRTGAGVNRMMADFGNYAFGQDSDFARQYRKSADIRSAYHPETMEADLINRAKNGTLLDYFTSENGAVAPAADFAASLYSFLPANMAIAVLAETAPVAGALSLLGKGANKVVTPLAKNLLGDNFASKYLAGRVAESVYGNKAAADIARNAVANEASREAAADLIGKYAGQKAAQAGYWSLLNASSTPIEAATEVGGSMDENESNIDDDITQEAYEAMQKENADKYNKQYWQNVKFLTGSNAVQGALFGAMGKVGKRLPRSANPQTVAQRAKNIGLNAAEFAALEGTELGSQVLEEMEQKAFSNEAEGKPYGYIPGYDMTPDQYQEGESALVGMGLLGGLAGGARYAGSRMFNGSQAENSTPNTDVDINGNEESNGETEAPRNYNISEETSNPNVASGTQSKLNQLADWYKQTYGREFTMTSGKRDGDGSSWHDSGNAFDIVDDLMESDADVRDAVMAKAQEIGLAGLDEYANPSEHATGGHMHFSDHGSEGIEADSDNGGYIGNNSSDYLNYIASLDNLDDISDMLAQGENGEVSFMDSEENRAKLDKMAKQQEDVVLKDKESVVALANEAATNRAGHRDMNGFSEAMEIIQSGDKNAMRELAREALRVRRIAKGNAVAVQGGIKFTTQNIDRARQQQGRVRANVGRQVPTANHQFGGLGRAQAQVGNQTPTGAVGLQNNGNYTGNEPGRSTAGQYGGLNYLNGYVNGQNVQGNENTQTSADQQQNIRPQQAQPDGNEVMRAGIAQANALMQQGDNAGAMQLIQAIQQRDTNAINAMLPQPVQGRQAVSTRQTLSPSVDTGNVVNGQAINREVTPRQLTGNQAQSGTIVMSQNQQQEQAAQTEPAAEEQTDKQISDIIRSNFDLVDTPEMWPSFIKVIPQEIRPLFNYIKAWFTTAGTGAQAIYDGLVHKRAKMIADRVKDLRHTMQQGYDKGGLFRDEHGEEQYVPTTSRNYQWYKDALNRFGVNGRLQTKDLDEILNVIAEEHLRNGYHDPYFTDIDVVEEHQRDFYKIEMSMLNMERMADYAARFANGKQKPEADSRQGSSIGNEAITETETEQEPVQDSTRSESEEVKQEVNNNEENQQQESNDTENQDSTDATSESGQVNAEPDENAENETAQGEVKAEADTKQEEQQAQEKENPTEDGGVELPDGYVVENGKPLVKENKDSYIVFVDKNGKKSRTMGEISSEIEKATNGKIKSSPIWLRVGDDGFGYIHLVKHLPEMKRKGFTDAISYIHHILNHFNKIYKDNPDSDRILLYCDGDESKGYMPIDLELSKEDGDHYSIVSAYPRRKAKGTLIYDGSAHPSTATTNGMLTTEVDNNGGVEATARAYAKDRVPKESVSQNKVEVKRSANTSQQALDKVGKAKIEDFGQKIGGARKDVAGAYINILKTNNDTDSMVKLSYAKAWKEPNYKAMLEEGVDADVVSAIRALRDGYKYGRNIVLAKKEWAGRAIKAKEVARKILEKWDSDHNATDATQIFYDFMASHIGETSPDLNAHAAQAYNNLYSELGHDNPLAKTNVFYGLYRSYQTGKTVGKYSGEIDGKSIREENLDDFTHKFIQAWKNRELKEKKNKADNDKPKWMQDFDILEKDDKFVINIKGDALPKVAFSTRKLKDEEYNTREEAEQAIKDNLLKENLAVRQEKTEANKDRYRLYLKHRTKNDTAYINLRDFATEEEANKFAKDNFEKIMEADLTITESILEAGNNLGWEEMRSDTAKDYRKGKDVTPEDYTKAFGFRGVQFGNWNNQKERQALLDASYDALMDLAYLLGIDPHILSLNGELGMAFGARGKAGKGSARAHFEPSYTVINLTKKTGAGSLAHEWLHALDNYLLIKGGAITTERTDDGELLKATGPLGHHMASAYSESALTNLDIPQTISKAFSDLIKTATIKERVVTVDTEKKQKTLARAEARADKLLNQIRDYLSKPRSYGKKKAAATEAQMAEFNDLAKKAFNQAIEWAPDAAPNGSLKYHYTNDALTKMSKLCKEITGRTIADIDDVAHALKSVERFRKEIADLQSKGGKETYEGKTDYYQEAKKLDGSRSKAYWTNTWEMLARAFSSYLEDKMIEMGFSSGFLNHDANNKATQSGSSISALMDLKPYPEGAERENINKAYDKFFEAIRNEIDRVQKETGEIKFSIRAAADRMDTEQSINAQDKLMNRLADQMEEKGNPEIADMLRQCKAVEPSTGNKVLGKLKEFAENMGCDLVFFEGPAKMHGFHHQGVTFINIHSEMALPKVFWHETFHWLRNNNKALYDTLIGWMQNKMTDEQIDAYCDKIGRPELKENKALAVEEMLADEAENAASRSKVIQQMMKEDEGLAKKFITWLKNAVDNFVKTFYSGRKEDGLLTNSQRDAFVKGFNLMAAAAKNSKGEKVFKTRQDGKVLVDQNGNDVKFSMSKRFPKNRELVVNPDNPTRGSSTVEIDTEDGQEYIAVTNLFFSPRADETYDERFERRVAELVRFDTSKLEGGDIEKYIPADNKTAIDNHLEDNWLTEFFRLKDLEHQLLTSDLETFVYTDERGRRYEVPEDEENRIGRLYILRGGIQYAERRIKEERNRVPAVSQGLLQEVLGLDVWNYEQAKGRVQRKLQAARINFSVNLANTEREDLASVNLNQNHPNQDGFFDASEDEYGVKFSLVRDKDKLIELNKASKTGKTFKAYRAMALIDGELYPPMATKTDSQNLAPASKIGKWEQADVNYDRGFFEIDAKDYKANKETYKALGITKTQNYKDVKPVKKDGKWQALVKGRLVTLKADSNTGEPALSFLLRKDDGGTVPARFNPYLHSSAYMLNDQFSSAYKRPNLVVVEMELPESELASGYRAKLAKDPVGKAKWKSGPVVGELTKAVKEARAAAVENGMTAGEAAEKYPDKGRDVYLSRWGRPVRVVPTAEVAKAIKKQLGDYNVAIPANTVNAELAEELRKLGVKIAEPESKEAESYNKWKNENAGDIKFSINNNANISFVDKLKNFFTAKNRDTTFNKNNLREQIEDLTGLKIRWGKLNGQQEAVLKQAEGVIRAKTAYDFQRVMPLAAKAICKTLNIKSTDAMNNYIADWVLTGAINNNGAEAQEFAKAMKANPDFADKLLDLQSNFDKYNNLSGEETARSIINFNHTEKTSLSDKINRAYDQWVEELGPVKRMTEELEQRMGKKFSALTNPYSAFRLYRGTAGRAMTLLEGKGKIVDALKQIYPNVDFKGFKTLNQILTSVGAINNEKAMQEFAEYCVACHVKEIHEANKQLPDNVKPMATPMTEQKCDEVLSAENNKRFGQAQKDLVRFSNTLAQIAHQSGIISTERYFQMIKKWKNYVPMFRVFDEDEDVAFGDSFDQHMTGSGRQVINPLESIIRNTFDIVAKSDKNMAKLKLVGVARCGGVGDILEEVDAPGKVGETISFREDGKTKYLQTDKDIVNAVNGMGKDSSNQFIKLLRMPAAIARSAYTVYNITFALRNVFRDVADAAIYAKYGFNPVKDLAAGFMHAWNQDEIFYEWLASGAAQSSRITLDRNYTQAELDKLTKTWKQKVGPKGLLELIQYASEISEAGTRIGVYTATKRAEQEKGANLATAIAEAAMQSRDLMDFARGGKASRTANQVIVFANASIQGWDKFFREFDPRDKKKFARRVASLFFTAMLPSLLLSLYNGNEDWYKELPEWQKQNHWVIKLGNTILRIPKGADIGIRFGSNLVEQMMAHYMNGKKVKATNVLKPLLDNTPDWAPTAITPILEAMANYSYFTERPIVPQKEQRLPAKMQYGTNTSALAKYIGEKLDISPRKIDHVLYGYTGKIGEGAVKIPERMYDTATGKGRLADFTLEQAPVASGILAVPYRSSQTVQDYYEEWDKQEKAYNEFKATKRKPKEFNPTEYERMKKLKKPLQELAQQERDVINNRTMTAEQKQDRQMAIQKRRISLMKSVLRK